MLPPEAREVVEDLLRKMRENPDAFFPYLYNQILLVEKDLDRAEEEGVSSDEIARAIYLGILYASYCLLQKMTVHASLVVLCYQRPTELRVLSVERRYTTYTAGGRNEGTITYILMEMKKTLKG